MEKKGFTLIEILVVVALTAILSGIAIVYSHVGQNQIDLSVEESKIAELILEAKELSVATYSTNAATCAYGVQFDYANSTYSLFEYDSASVSGGGREICPSVASTSQLIYSGDVKEYAQGSWNVKVAPGVVLVNGGAASGTIQDVMFYPPDPCTMVSMVGQTTFLNDCVLPDTFSGAAHVYLRTADNSQSRTISVSPAGQVSL